MLISLQAEHAGYRCCRQPAWQSAKAPRNTTTQGTQRVHVLCQLRPPFGDTTAPVLELLTHGYNV